MQKFCRFLHGENLEKNAAKKRLREWRYQLWMNATEIIGYGDFFCCMGYKARLTIIIDDKIGHIMTFGGQRLAIHH